MREWNSNLNYREVIFSYLESREMTINNKRDEQSFKKLKKRKEKKRESFSRKVKRDDFLDY